MTSWGDMIMSKYHSKKVTVGGITFDSKKEADRYAELKMLERLGVIHSLELQKKYELIPAQKLPIPVVSKNCMKKVEKAITYKADFVYVRDGQTIVEDVKGMRTEVYKIKRKLMLYIHGIQVMEI